MINMNKIILVVFGTALMLGTASGVPTITFSPGGADPGGWIYNGTGTFTFPQMVTIDKGLNSALDTLVTSGARVYIPDMTVGGIPGSPYTLNPATSTILIKSADGSVTYLSGTIGQGDLVPDGGTGGNGYTQLSADITDLQVNNTIGSSALTAIEGASSLDFHLSISGDRQFNLMLDNGGTEEGDFAGNMTVITPTVPAPGAVLLGSIGVALVGWMRARRQL